MIRLDLQAISFEYSEIRRVRRDGSCFYRSLLFSIFERITVKKDKKLLESILTVVKQSKIDLQTVGYEEMVLEDFYDPLVENLNKSIEQTFTLTDL